MPRPTYAPTSVLTLNAGSSSLKFALFRTQPSLVRILSGQVERIGLPNPLISLRDLVADTSERHAIDAREHIACLPPLLSWIESRVGLAGLLAVGHRIVHGGDRYGAPQWVTPPLQAELRKLRAFDPEHLPAALGLIDGLRELHPSLAQAVCFDTAFHHDLPRVATLLPIPRRYQTQGLRRYGFHGLSYAYLMEALARSAGSSVAQGRVILAHLGNGASMSAVHHGRCVDTTMGFTPSSGLPMGTRSGDLDPGVAAYVCERENMSAAQFYAMATLRSGLLGVSETSSDARELLARESEDVRAAEALELFCYQAKKSIGALSAALGGLDTLVFSGGIGENSAELRERICAGLGFLGIEIDPARNAAHAPILSRDCARVGVRVLHTDEEVQIARSLLQLEPQSV